MRSISTQHSAQVQGGLPGWVVGGWVSGWGSGGVGAGECGLNFVSEPCVCAAHELRMRFVVFKNQILMVPPVSLSTPRYLQCTPHLRLYDTYGTA